MEPTRDRLTRHARSLLRGRYARLGPLAQTDDAVQQLYLKALRNQGRFWVTQNRRGRDIAINNIRGMLGMPADKPPAASTAC